MLETIQIKANEKIFFQENQFKTKKKGRHLEGIREKILFLQ